MNQPTNAAKALFGGRRLDPDVVPQMPTSSLDSLTTGPDGGCDTAIIGAGIVALALAVRLQLEGRQVMLLDPKEPASGTSFGNAGYLSRGSIFPPASPEMMRRLPQLMLDPSGPLVIRPSYAHRMVPWGIRLMAASRPKPLSRIVEALAALCRDAVTSYRPLLAAAGAEDMIDVRGSLVVCRTQATLEQKAAAIPMLRKHGIAAERIDGAEARRMEPALAADIAGAVYFPDNARCVSPGAMGARFAESVRAKGGTLRQAAVSKLHPQGEGWMLETSTGPVAARKVVVAAGRWSDELLTPLGYTIPLISERGYHLMLPQADVSLSRPCVMAEPFFAATPMRDGLRLAGTVEFANTGAPMNPKRSDKLYELAVPYLPGLRREAATRWMGVRPSLPDALPAIGAASGHRNLFYCFGHQHIGLTTAAISAQLLADVMLQRTPSLDPAPFNLDRFRRRQSDARAA